MDSFRLYMLHFYLFDHMLKLGLYQTAEAFVREAETINAAAGVNIPDSYLGQFWSQFWDALDDSYAGIRAESSDQGADRGLARAQIRAHSQALAEARSRGPSIDQVRAHLHEHAQAQIHAHAQAHVYAHAQAQVQVQAQSHVQVQIQSRAQAHAYGLGQASVNHIQIYDISSQPIVGPTWNGEHGFQQGLVQEPSRHNTVRGSHQPRRRGNRSRGQRGRANGRNPA